MLRLARPLRTGHESRLRVLAARMLLGLLGGAALWLAFPGYDVWWLAILGCAALALATAGASWWAGGLCGLMLGVTWFTPMFIWAGTYAGTPAWLAMSAASALYPAALGVVLTLVQRTSVRPLIGAAAWVLMEWARSVTPFGGFPWARLGFSQADSPMLGAVSLLTVPGLGFLVALAGGLLAVAAQRILAPGRTDLRRAATALAGATAVVVAPVLVPRPTAGEQVTVAAVQGDIPEGYSRTLTVEPGTMLDQYVGPTQELAARVTAGGAAPADLLVWPEGATDLDPLDPQVGQAATDQIMAAVEAVGVPLLLGGLSRQGGTGPPSNMTFSYLPGRGLDQTYSKVYLAPFGEVMPLRPLLKHLSPWVDRVVDLRAGDRPGLISVPLSDEGPVDLGLAICFEIVVDRAVRDLVTGGAQLLVVPTSNAWFGDGDQSVQHLAISRVRAVEYGRSVVHASNVGVSGLISPDGVVHERSDPYTQATLLGQLPLRTEQTLAVHTGPWVVPAAALVVAVGLFWQPRRRLPHFKPGHTQAPDPGSGPSTPDLLKGSGDR